MLYSCSLVYFSMKYSLSFIIVLLQYTGYSQDLQLMIYTRGVYETKISVFPLAGRLL
jgi:hypothetical protein